MENNEQIKVTPIRLGRVAAYLVQDRRPILVDTGFPLAEGVILAALAQQGMSPHDLALIIITHGHVDHYGSAAALHTRTGAPVAIHALDADALRKGENAALHPTLFVAKLMIPFARMAKAQGIEPQVILEDDMDLGPYGVNAKVIHTPGHTPGSISLLLANGDVIVGDLVTENLLHPGQPTPRPLFVENLEQMKASVERILSYAPKRILAAHGGPLDPEIVRRMVL